MDNCIHGIDVRNPCETCAAVANLPSVDRSALERRAKMIVKRTLPSDYFLELLILGELAMAWRAGRQYGERIGG